MSMPFPVMLASEKSQVPVSKNYIYEVKWDGIRVILEYHEGTLKIWSRRNNHITNKFPELLVQLPFKCHSGIFDGEIVCFDAEGKPNFRKVMGRLANSAANARSASQVTPARCIVFDCLKLDDRELLTEALINRKKRLSQVIEESLHFRVSQWFEDGQALYQGVKEQDLEGIIAKTRDSWYYPGQRTNNWIKIKNRKKVYCVITGYKKGQGERAKTFSSLMVAEISGLQLIDRGNVGSGFDQRSLRQLRELMDMLVTDAGETKTTIEPKIVCEVEFAEIDSEGSFRAPVYKGLKGEWDARNGLNLY